MKQTIRYFTADSPSQPAERWRITAQQSVQGGDVLSQTFCFAQGGLRYALPANAVYEVFPKEQQMGDFSQVLPHILLRGWNQKEELLAPGDRDHILSGVFNQFLSANPRASRINKKSANNPALID